MQGIARLRSALHAHMWPGMVMKPKPGARPPRALSSGDESDFSIEYELLEEDRGRGGLSPERNAGASEPVQLEVRAGGVGEAALEAGVSGGDMNCEGKGQEGPGQSQEERERDAGAEAEPTKKGAGAGASSAADVTTTERNGAGTVRSVPGRDSDGVPAEDPRPQPSGQQSVGAVGPVPSEERTKSLVPSKERTKSSEGNGSLHLDEAAAMREVEHEGDSDFAEMERIMHQMTSVRDRVSGLPDGARREEAARYAMRLMEMFGGEESEGEGE